MSYLVIDTKTFSMNNINSVIRSSKDRNNSFNILRDIIYSNQIRGMHYTDINNLGEAQKSAWVDGYEINNSFFMKGKSIEL